MEGTFTRSKAKLDDCEVEAKMDTRVIRMKEEIKTRRAGCEFLVLYDTTECGGKDVLRSGLSLSHQHTPRREGIISTVY